MPETSLKSRLPVLVPLGEGQGNGRRRKEEVDFQWVRQALSRTQGTLETSREGEELHRLLFEKVPHPRFVCDIRTLRILGMNEAAVQRYGYSRDQFLSMKVTDLAAAEYFADFESYCQTISSSRLDAAGPDDSVFRHRKKDGKLMDIKVDVALIPLRRRRMFLLLAQDVTEQRRALQRLRTQQDITRVLAESSTLAEAGPKLFHAICENFGCDWGELWRVDPAAQGLRCTQIWHPQNPAVTRDATLHSECNLCQRRRNCGHCLGPQQARLDCGHYATSGANSRQSHEKMWFADGLRIPDTAE